MERLTVCGHCKFGWSYVTKPKCKDCKGCKHHGEIIMKLSEYEDIGTVNGFKDSVVLLKLLSKHGLTPDEVVELSAAKAEGRLAVLPCNVGDTLYWVGMYRGKKRIVEYKAQNFTFFDDGYYVTCGTTIRFWDNEIGRKVYLTRAEAEKALGES